LKPSKCHFFKSEEKYLGHIVSGDGVKTDPEKVQVVRDWPTPKSVKNVQQFLGFSGLYRRFIKDYSKVARPLHNLLVGSQKNTTKTTKFIWNSEAQSAFDQLKAKLISAPVLAYANYTIPFEVHVDASSSGLGAVLYQTQNGPKRIVSYASRGLSQSER
jgi:hypothetical protein